MRKLFAPFFVMRTSIQLDPRACNFVGDFRLVNGELVYLGTSTYYFRAQIVAEIAFSNKSVKLLLSKNNSIVNGLALCVRATKLRLVGAASQVVALSTGDKLGLVVLHSHKNGPLTLRNCGMTVYLI
jgi:hypothetical protein